MTQPVLTDFLALALWVCFSICQLAPCVLAQPASSEASPKSEQAGHPRSVINHKLPAAIGNRLTIKEVQVFGTAETTKWKLITDGKERTYLIVFGKNDDIIAGLYRFLDATKIQGGHFTAIGAVGAAALGFFRPEDHTYKVVKIETQTEVSSLVGNIGMKNGKPVVHAHGVFSLNDASCVAGHVFYASAWPTVEMTVTECQTAPIRHLDDESGLWLYDTEAETK
jgi:hypothetical protein